MKRMFVPFTPAGSPLMDLERRTEEAAWKALERATRHMPYPDRAALIARGYTVCELQEVPSSGTSR